MITGDGARMRVNISLFSVWSLLVNYQFLKMVTSNSARQQCGGT
ncbi:hypothetical protein CASFOL_000385 [Castilleja foliolosa]|uniref:Uncharacterized protein n=1 Tax=Castilleja foliolosa TaxID=1961234 RepID=A0ABD3ESC4_9LAMI